MSESKYPSLNLPSNTVKTREKDGKPEIFDPVRKKYLVLTPEEWVRQHLIGFLHEQREYPFHLMAVEYSLKVNQLKKRCDIIAFDRQLKPLVIIEVKAPEVPLDQKVLDQVVRYNIPFGAPYLIISNGLHHFAVRLIHKEGRVEVLSDIPDYSKIVNQ